MNFRLFQLKLTILVLTFFYHQEMSASAWRRHVLTPIFALGGAIDEDCQLHFQGRSLICLRDSLVYSQPEIDQREWVRHILEVNFHLEGKSLSRQAIINQHYENTLIRLLARERIRSILLDYQGHLIPELFQSDNYQIPPFPDECLREYPELPILHAEIQSDLDERKKRAEQLPISEVEHDLIQGYLSAIAYLKQLDRAQREVRDRMVELNNQYRGYMQSAYHFSEEAFNSYQNLLVPLNSTKKLIEINREQLLTKFPYLATKSVISFLERNKERIKKSLDGDAASYTELENRIPRLLGLAAKEFRAPYLEQNDTGVQYICNQLSSDKMDKEFVPQLLADQTQLDLVLRGSSSEMAYLHSAACRLTVRAEQEVGEEVLNSLIIGVALAASTAGFGLIGTGFTGVRVAGHTYFASRAYLPARYALASISALNLSFLALHDLPYLKKDCFDDRQVVRGEYFSDIQDEQLSCLFSASFGVLNAATSTLGLSSTVKSFRLAKERRVAQQAQQVQRSVATGQRQQVVELPEQVQARLIRQGKEKGSFEEISFNRSKNEISVRVDNRNMEAGYIRYRVNEDDDLLNISEIFISDANNYRGRGLSTLLIGDALMANPNIQRIRSDLGGMNQSIFLDAVNSAIDGGSDLQNAILNALRTTPATKSKNHFGFSLQDISVEIKRISGIEGSYRVHIESIASSKFSGAPRIRFAEYTDSYELIEIANPPSSVRRVRGDLRDEVYNHLDSLSESYD